MQPSYLRLYHSGELDERIAQLYAVLEKCVLCPRRCGKNRLIGEKGYCGMGEDLVVSAIHPHFGEEEPLVGGGRLLGIGGSGTIFLTGCNLGCVYCQNYDISHLGRGSVISPRELAVSIMELQKRGCYNINFVTPTHFVPQLIAGLKIAIEKGLNIPIVYNCGGYENLETIKLLDGIIDIYMPDIKYSNPQHAECYSNAPDYFERCSEAVKEMYRQVGDLNIDSAGIAQRGLLVRHLVLPNGLAGSREIMRFIADDISRDTYVNIMLQYHPLFRAAEHEKLNRKPSIEEYQEAIAVARDSGLHSGFE